MHADAEALFEGLDRWLARALADAERDPRSPLCPATLRECRAQLLKARERRAIDILRSSSPPSVDHVEVPSGVGPPASLRDTVPPPARRGEDEAED
jgi:hypothetical protein